MTLPLDTASTPQHPDFASKFPNTCRVYSEGVVAGQQRGLQLWVSLKGEVRANFALGEARDGVPMLHNTIMPWRSCSKPIAAIAMAQLWEKGALKLDQPVADFIPDFEMGGKAGITIRHILTHTAGIRHVAFDDPMGDWDTIIRRIAEVTLEPDWRPGRRAAYHVRSSWFLLGEIVRVIDGRSFEQYIRDEIFLPLGMDDCYIGMSDEEFDAKESRIGILWDTSHQPPRPDPFFSGEAVTLSSPGSSGHGPMEQLGRLYEALRRGGELDGTRILLPQTVEAITVRHRVGLQDETFMHGMDWGLGFIINSNRHGADTVPYGFGRLASPRTFGHGGSQSSSSFTDPDVGLSVAVVFNGTPGDARHSRRIRNFATALYEDMKISGL
ncbi:serine hydrolase [candidate division BRC1 bacterium HGW-BRC1-1]|jgi:CubicO group peptidase (beta-lactamase class C family)|nr:MAG: serine hydrolase [candidate division BRC1 bacterium HGW-BRC1-1]